ncbi:MAG: SHOCT-like domain-containing protein [Bacillota bacterium]
MDSSERRERAVKEERPQVLTTVKEGKITVEEGLRLLEALDEPVPRGPAGNKQPFKLHICDGTNARALRCESAQSPVEAGL